MIRKQKQRNNRKSLAGTVLSAILACCLAAGSLAGMFCYAAEQPLFVFDYQGSRIETYVDYSVVDGVVCETHRYFVKNGNLVLVDQKLQPTPRDIFIHFEGGKSYIVILNRSGQLVSLGTEDMIRTLDRFSNRNIASINNNLFATSTTLYVTYNDGSTVSYDCVTGRLLSGTPSTEKKSISEYVSGYLTDVFDRSTQGFADTSGAMAQSVVTALEGSGASLEDLMSAGLAENIEQAYQNAGRNWNGEVYEFGQFASDNGENAEGSGFYSASEGPAPGGTASESRASVDAGASEEFYATGEPDGVTEDFGVNRSGEMPYGEVLQSEEYSSLMTSAELVLSKEQLVELRNLFAKMATGDISAAEAAGELAFFLPDDTAEDYGLIGEGRMPEASMPGEDRMPETSMPEMPEGDTASPGSMTGESTVSGMGTGSADGSMPEGSLPERGLAESSLSGGSLSETGGPTLASSGTGSSESSNPQIISGEPVIPEASGVSGNVASAGAVSGSGASAGAVSGNGASAGAVSGSQTAAASGEVTISAGSGEGISGTVAPGGEAAGGTVSRSESAAESSSPDGSAPASGSSGNRTSGSDTPEAVKTEAERKASLEKFRESIEQMQAALEEIEKKQSEKEYIQSSFKDKYISVYNAEEKRYDIYSQETVMKKPDELVSESSKLTDRGSAEALNRLLAGEKGSTAQSGFNLFIIIAASIVAAAAILLVIVAKNTRVKKSDK